MICQKDTFINYSYRRTVVNSVKSVHGLQIDIQYMVYYLYVGGIKI